MSTKSENLVQQSSGLLSGFTVSDFVMICAVLLAPVIAVQVDKFLEKSRKKKEQKLDVFKTLMSTRGRAIDLRHVEALNMIDLEFDGIKQVTDSWKAYLDHLTNMPKYPTIENKSDETKRSEKAIYDSQVEIWANQREALLADLLHTMGSSLGYNFDKTHIRRSIYAPQGHADVENDHQFIRQSVISLLTGRSALPIETIGQELTEEAVQAHKKEKVEQQEIRELMIKHYKGEAPIHVKFFDEKKIDE